ncbi:hypothetical protein ACFPRL_30880 [Pseudoclavibacter helvolus]
MTTALVVGSGAEPAWICLVSKLWVIGSLRVGCDPTGQSGGTSVAVGAQAGNGAGHKSSRALSVGHRGMPRWVHAWRTENACGRGHGSKQRHRSVDGQVPACGRPHGPRNSPSRRPSRGACGGDGCRGARG